MASAMVGPNGRAKGVGVAGGQGESLRNGDLGALETILNGERFVIPFCGDTCAVFLAIAAPGVNGTGVGRADGVLGRIVAAWAA